LTDQANEGRADRLPRPLARPCGAS